MKNSKSKENIIKKEFSKLSTEIEPKNKLIKNCFFAFIIGGLLCVVGQFFNNLFTNMGLSEENVGSTVSIIMVFIGASLTGVGIYDKIANFAGAGTVVPITGFANSIVAPAIEFKKEGFVFGVGAKMFTIAGPVLVYGISTSVIVGIIHYCANYLFK
ncbi:stage V sporulation protein AC [Clostridium hydrogeniformans]|uniref:stage V sporulation protein AC n=1 Tax=Clostridium hydrogeniformans TaxID=349933 RepID=UPI00048821D7|nr:stage V sporulation protein AC [Clostridium hydrogeniformans]